MLAPNRLLPWCLEAYTWYTMTAGNLMYHNPKLHAIRSRNEQKELACTCDHHGHLPILASHVFHHLWFLKLEKKTTWNKKTNKPHPMDSSKKKKYRQKAFPNLYSLS